MDAQQKRLFAALAFLLAAIMVYDVPGFLYWLDGGTDLDRVLSNTRQGNIQTVVMDLTKPDPWAMHAWIRQVCYALLGCSMIALNWQNIAARSIGATAFFWYTAQALDARFTLNIFDDGLWEYGLLTAAVALCSLMIYHTGWKRHDA